MDFGINISMSENVSSPARRVADDLGGIAKAGDRINDALDPRILEEYDKKLTQIGESYSKLRDIQNKQAQSYTRQVQNVASSTGTALSQLGTGNVGGSAMAAGRGLAGLTSFLGGPATLLAGLGMAAAGTTNALAAQYEQRAEPARQIAAMTGRFSTDIDENTKALREVMAKTVDSVAKYGKTFEEGAMAQETFFRAGGRNFGASRAAAYSMAYGADFNQLAAFEGLTQRYGQAGALNQANALMQAQGLGPAQYEEIMGSIQDLFTTGLSQGLIKSTEDIASQLEFFSRAGQTWQGSLGANRVQGINQAVAGAGGLQQQSDLFLYRAAQNISKGGLLETREIMEKGLTPELYKGLLGQFREFGLGADESILQLSKMFGLTITSARQMYNLQGQDISNENLKKYALPEGQGVTRETQYIGDVESLKQAVAGVMGAEAFDLRAKIVGATDDMLGALKGFFTNIRDINTENIIVQAEAKQRESENRTFSEEMFNSLLMNVKGAEVVPGVPKFGEMILKTVQAGVTGAQVYEAVGEKYQEFRKRGTEGEMRGLALGQTELSTLEGILNDLVSEYKKTNTILQEPSPVEVIISGDSVRPGRYTQ